MMGYDWGTPRSLLAQMSTHEKPGPVGSQTTNHSIYFYNILSFLPCGPFFNFRFTETSRITGILQFHDIAQLVAQLTDLMNMDDLLDKTFDMKQLHEICSSQETCSSQRSWVFATASSMRR